jgi:dihydrofolate reductase
MRKIINATFVTLDGAVDEPHLWPDSGDSKGESDRVHTQLLESSDLVVMGRRTYDSFAAVWPARTDPFSKRLNAVAKVVVSGTLRNPTWSNTTTIAADPVGELQRIKARPGKNILQYGIGRLTYAMIEHGLLDEMHLWLHPVILGRKGPALPHFRECPTTQLKLIGSNTLPNDVLILRYEVRKSS